MRAITAPDYVTCTPCIKVPRNIVYLAIEEIRICECKSDAVSVFFNTSLHCFNRLE